jgi:PilZ domain
MQALSQTFSDISLSDPALWLAVGAGLFVILVCLILRRPRQPAKFRAPVVPAQPPAGSADWENPLPAARADERRRAIRRGGLPTPILIVDPKVGRRGKPMEAYVLDRSTGGLRLALEKPVGVGTTLLAKPGNAPDGFEWVKILVRNCREVGDYFEVGCQFETDLELNRLLMFG